ncbi:MAG TPA: hypothetical protein VGR72_14690 [Candidatus Acidoferrales bacterium]|nr:hypothetical protein [Candidatus Acidoferrales bacterium]
MLEHFEKSDDVKGLTLVFLPVFIGSRDKGFLQAIVASREFDCISIYFYAGDIKAVPLRSGQEISHAASDVEKPSILGRAGIRKKKLMSGLERHLLIVTALVYDLMPGIIGHFDRVPEIKIAGRAMVEGSIVKMLLSRALRN